MEIKDKIIEKIQSVCENALLDIYEFRDELTLIINYTEIVNVCRTLKKDEDLQFVYCKDITAIDNAKRKNRFTLVYHLYSFYNNINLRVKAEIPEESISSVVCIYPAADWHERETHDMFGIIFIDHPDLRRMYMPEEFEYYPLRKEFPLMGIPGSLTLPRK